MDDDPLVKVCSRCGLTKPLEQFPLKNRWSTGRQSHCRLGVATEAALRAEIAKCEVVCANCHRLRTYEPALAVDDDASGEEEDGGTLFEGFASQATSMGT